MAVKRPNSRRNLDMAIRRLCGAEGDYVRTRTAIADAVVAQLLPDGAVKGGAAFKFRFGDSGTRATTDLDVARKSELDDYVERFAEALDLGWNGFAGALVPRDPASPAGVLPQYVMQPYEVKLSYLGAPWCTVPFELGHDEIGDADAPEYVMPMDAARYLAALGFPEPSPVPVMPLDHQIAQKIHAVSAPGSKRAHDLIDLQLIVAYVSVDYAATKRTCERLFSYRKGHAWPPAITMGEDWEGLYAQQAKGLDVLQSVDEAVAWANGFIRRIDEAGE